MTMTQHQACESHFYIKSKSTKSDKVSIRNMRKNKTLKHRKSGPTGEVGQLSSKLISNSNKSN